jgi:hypothetical protein
MNGMAFIVSIVIAACVWLALLLRKMRRLENERFYDKVYENAEKDISGRDLLSLVDDTNEDASRRH